MYTIEEIFANIQPVPQSVKAGKTKSLKILPTSKICLTAPVAEKGPVKTAAEELAAFFKKHLDEQCLCDNGIAVTLELGEAPKKVKNANEGYRIVVKSTGVTITGFGPAGLFYGVQSFKQMCRWDAGGLELPSVEILDWPDRAFRCFFEETRFGSNVMTKQDWLDMIDDLAAKKYNYFNPSLYSCWGMQYDGRPSSYLYFPVKDYPQLKTPQMIKYYSPTEKCWVEYEKLPPIFEEDFFGELVTYAKDRGMDVFPLVNSLGHNVLFPSMLPEVAAKDENGVPSKVGFCTSSEETYKLLFSIYDDLIDNYLLPNDIHAFSIGLDEVVDQCGVDPEDPAKMYSPWCQCEKCRTMEKSDMALNHIIKLVTHLKEKGITSVMICYDMICRAKKSMGDLRERLVDALEKAGIADTVLVNWWYYTDRQDDFVNNNRIQPTDYNLRCVCSPWNGYFIWSLLTNPLRNIQMQAAQDRRVPQSEGMTMYSMWSRSSERVQDCFTDYSWNYGGSGTVRDVTERYVARHFAPMQREVVRAYDLIDSITEEHTQKFDAEFPEQSMVSTGVLLTSVLTYYNSCYYSAKESMYPRHFPGFILNKLLPYRWSYERALFSITSMAQEAIDIFKKAAVTAGCDQAMARRMVYECWNYLVHAADALALLEMYDLTQKGDYKRIAPIARERQNQRLAIMEYCQQVKDLWECEGATLRNHSVYMKVFDDIANYIENTDEPKLDLFDITPIMSKEHWNIR